MTAYFMTGVTSLWEILVHCKAGNYSQKKERCDNSYSNEYRDILAPQCK